MNDLISVIVATYNREDALGAVLRALSRQTDRGFEVVVADDGSRPDTAAVVAGWTSRMPMALKHVWQEDCGFRAAESRNRAIRASAGAYCVFLDGDCIARPDFIAAHRALAEPGYFVSGNRVLLSAVLTERILSAGLEPESWSLAQFLAHRRRREVNRILPLLRLPLGPLRKLGGARWQGARSCNAGCFRDDLSRVDGFDAAYSGWGREDSDLFVRLIRSGVRRKNGRFATGVLHLWHPEGERSQLPHNQAKLERTLSSGRWRAVRGLSTLDVVSTES
ncbi:MAG TPA: glycosyltransferase family 2 protein [Xanthobacteraceae bacterium]|jgi:glycosyltransferase involved in cell wall biosynthesis|nr:glycosyltransferase family 2 protein [Xanthobacteraceae bacterium]